MDQPLLPLLLVPDTLASAPLRGALLMGFVIALFGAAFAAVKIGQRKRATQAASDLSALTGTGDGAHRGGDVSVSSDWWNAAVTDEEEPAAPSQSWQSAFLDYDPAPHAEVSEPAYGKTLDVPVPAEHTVPVYEPPVPAVVAPEVVSEPIAPVTEPVAADPAPEVIAWSDVETDEGVIQWESPLVDAVALDQDALAKDGPVDVAVDAEAASEPAPVAPGHSEPVRTDITYVPDAAAAPYAYSAPAVAQVAAAAIYEEPAVAAPVVDTAAVVAPAETPVEVPAVEVPAFDVPAPVAPEPVFDAPVFEPAPVEPAVFGAPISLSATSPASADNSWGADETGDDDGISPTWWQQAIADDK